MKEEDYQNILRGWYSEEIVNKIIQGEKQERYVTLRVNRLKANKEEVIESFLKAGVKYQNVSWYKDALIILNKREKDIRELDIYKEGKIYLQSLSSMIPPLVLEASKDEYILDMTAAPGGKTSEIAALSNNQAVITAVEKNKIRAERLKYNLENLGVKKVGVMVRDARIIDDNYKFDKILLDAPCSGSGTLKISDGVITNVFNLELIERVKSLQIELLRKAISLVNKGGIIVYATCSILNWENEDIVNKLVKEGKVEIVKIEGFEEKIFRNSKIVDAIKILPDELYEGFFVVKLRRIK